ncbi:cysteine desulfurase family protein [Sneathiella litorea]|uniref:Cysteine desulfurase n=1 Tax=Sneathiella litorea TaxID=2606216 RepID=A0A6L8WB16_9PROT|nr:cysteine desulfurase family protein [Sneathiella litorea]MZR31337.1 aminotransferase class V-fold PLP-dependent enzyme [Sneathiella litorea]
MPSQRIEPRQITFAGEVLSLPVYLDYQASTPLDHRVETAMSNWTHGFTGNPHSSNHIFGHQARRIIEEAQTHIASLINARPHEIIFTSGATEANNLALLGVARAHEGRRHIISVQTEHEAVLQPLEYLATHEGVEVTLLPVDKDGLIDHGALVSAIRPDTIIISVMAANNETGVCQDIARIGQICTERSIVFHSDAVQALSTEAIDVTAQNISLLSLSGHKLYGPMGIGALYVREGTDIAPLIYGGAQQRSIRPGTLPTALCVGLGEACRILAKCRTTNRNHLNKLRSSMVQRLSAELKNSVRLNGDMAPHIPGCLSLSFAGIDAEDLLHELPDLALSTGSACSSMNGKPSHVLKAMGMKAVDIAATIRLGLGRTTTQAEVHYATDQIIAAYNTLQPGKTTNITHQNGMH